MFLKNYQATLDQQIVGTEICFAAFEELPGTALLVIDVGQTINNERLITAIAIFADCPTRKHAARHKIVPFAPGGLVAGERHALRVGRWPVQASTIARKVGGIYVAIELDQFAREDRLTM